MNFIRLTLVFCWYAITVNIPGNGVNASWQIFTSSPSYANMRMTTDQDDGRASRRIPKEGNSQFWAAISCIRACAMDQFCKAVTLYKTEAFYTCELLPDNMCNNGTSTILSSMNGSIVWDKLSSGQKQACFEQKFKNTTIACQDLRPGCLGLWPNCYNCTRTCKDCSKRYNLFTGYKTCTLWPEGDSPSTVPLNGQCSSDKTLLIRRQINQTTGQIITDFRMPFKDMSRLSNLKSYSYLRFTFFITTNLPYYVQYKDVYIDSNGTLRNVSFNPLNFKDLLQTSILTSKSVPFVTVTDDKYGCGSFWLINSANATYCPGGTASIFGPVKVNGTKVLSTGIQFDVPFVTFNSFELALSEAIF